MDGVSYTWNANGNLLSDGENSYGYDSANRMTSTNNGQTFAYNGLGDRLSDSGGWQHYTIDLNTDLTQVLTDKYNTYLYGQGSISQEMSDYGYTVYFLSDALGSVRQVVNSQGFVRTGSYTPYGERLGSNVLIADTRFGFTGEMSDAGLLYLRARHYDPEMGRFTTRDTWGGDYSEPMSYNAWLYAGDNPVNYTDPTGLWRWWLSSSVYHMLIEQYYEGIPFNPTKQLEFPIPGTPFRHPDMFNSSLGDIYEIEPWYLQSAALSQVLRYQADLLAAAGGGSISGKYLGISYNWTSTPFHVGTGIDWPGKYRIPMPYFPAVDLVADYVGNGTVIYWFEPNALAIFGALPFIVPNKYLVRPPNWTPGRYAPQPAYAISISEACGYGLILLGGTIIAVTVVEDISTLGIGIFDDAITVPAGILFINWGQRLAVLVPVSAP